MLFVVAVVLVENHLKFPPFGGDASFSPAGDGERRVSHEDVSFQE
jgi:hypothetical protein